MAVPVRRTRLLVLALAAALALGGIAGCSSNNGGVKCTLSNCTVTLNRGVDAKVSVLGVDIKLVDVTNDQVTIDVNGNQLVVPASGGEAESGGLNVSVQKVTADQVILQVSQG